MAREALARLTDGGKLRLLVSPADADRLRAQKQALLSALAPGGQVEIVADETLQPGDVLVQSEAGEVDARLATQLDTLARRLQAEPAAALRKAS
jgi:flagellar biosynthesis/type III secretory pathway protein FliH